VAQQNRTANVLVAELLVNTSVVVQQGTPRTIGIVVNTAQLNMVGELVRIAVRMVVLMEVVPMAERLHKLTVDVRATVIRTSFTVTQAQSGYTNVC